MDIAHMDSSTLWASILWGGIAGGYVIYGWRQRSAIPFAGGMAMTFACFLSALPMTLVSIGVMVAVYWLMKNGYG